MAAVLCKGIGELCLLPCRCCASGCKGCNHLCGGACKGCGTMCQNICKNPFATVVVVALCTQVPVVFLMIPELSGIPDCQGSLWLLANGVLACVNIFTAFYLAYKIVDTSDPKMADKDTAFKRVSYLLCHDVWMAFYICIFIGFMCVQAWGAAASFQSTFLDEEDLDEDDGCSDTVDSMVNICSSLGWAFVFLGFWAVLFSLCCARFDMNDYTAPPPTSNNNSDPENPNVATPPPYQAHTYGKNSNTGYNQQGAPNNDFVNQPAAASATTYTKDGIPTNDMPANSGKSSYSSQPAAAAPQEDIPMAYAEEIPQRASAPPAEYDGNHQTNNATANESKPANTGGSYGGTAGKKLGKLLTADEKKQQKLEETGKKAGDTLGKGFMNAKKFVQSRLSKDDEKKT